MSTNQSLIMGALACFGPLIFIMVWLKIGQRKPSPVTATPASPGIPATETKIVIEKMSPGKAKLIAATAFSIVMAIGIGLCQLTLGSWLDRPFLTVLGCGTMMGLAIYLAWGLRVIPQNEFRVTERLGEYHETKNQGVRLFCLLGIIDQVAADGGNGDFKLKRQDLYQDEGEEKNGRKNEIDFTDASAPIRAQTWYRIKGPLEDPDAPARWVYATKGKSENRVEEILDGSLRPKLQKHSIDSAQTSLDEIVAAVKDDSSIINSMSEMGAVLDEKKGLILTDIVLSPEIQKLRLERLQGRTDANRQELRGQGYANAIRNIMKAANETKAPGEELMTFQEAREIYETQRGLETIQETGANISFVSPGLQGVLATINVGGNKQSGQKGGKN